MNHCYSLTWAKSVVDRLADKYPRALSIFVEITGITRRMLAKLLADGRMEYNVCKVLIHKLNDRIERCGEGSTDVKYYADFIIPYAVKMPFSMRRYLTSRIEDLQSKSSDSREMADGGEAEGSHQPSTLEVRIGSTAERWVQGELAFAP